MKNLKKLDRIDSKKNIEDIIALTPMQEGMLFHYLQDPGSDYYFEQLSLEIAGEVNVEVFTEAWNFVIQSNEMLRAVFRWKKPDRPIQIILKKNKIQPRYYDFSVSKKKTRIEEIKVKERKEKFDLHKAEVPFRVTLCRIDKYRYEMIISNHHILYDGWSNGVILKEFFQVYDELCKGNGNPIIPPVKAKFKEFVIWIQERETKEQDKFWKAYLKGFDTPTGLPIIRKNRVNAINNPGSFNIGFPGVVSGKAEGFVKKHKLTMASLIYGVWGLLLQKYNNCRDVIFGVTASGRQAKIKGIENMVGLLINTLPLRVYSPTDERVVDLLSRIDGMLLAREEYEHTPLVNIKAYADMDNKSELFDFLVVLENYPIHGRLKGQKGTLALQSYSMFEMTHYALTMQITLFDDIEMTLNYNKALLDESTIVKLAHDFIGVTRDVINYPGRMVSEIDILSEEEKKKILFVFNDTKIGYPEDKTIHELFAEQVEKVGEKISVVYQDNHLSCGELNERANRLAAQLKQLGITGDTLVGLLIHPSLEMIVGILGILKSAGSYLPLDTGYPLERIRYIVKDSSLKLLLSQGALGKRIDRRWDVDVLDLLDFNLDTVEGKNLPGINSAGNSAYVIYTSGSTGIPKGVAINHRSITNLLFGLLESYPFGGSDAYLLKTSYTFDVSVTELFGWIPGMGRLAIIGQDERKDIQKILNTIEKLFITHINFVPSMFKVFLELLNHENIEKLSSLKYIFLAGETLLPGLVNKFGRLNSSVVLENIYGPTEAAVYASSYSLSHWKDSDHIPIGTPLPNVELYILDRYDHLQPIGIVGELCIGGAGVGRGYLNRPELTAEKFDQDLGDYQDYQDKRKKVPGKRIQKNHMSYMSYRTYISKKIYKTGDLARWLPDGNVEFLGRMDQQVKIRGFRIEPGEIEKALNRHESITDCVVVAKDMKEFKEESDEKQLCAYFTADNVPPVSGLREYLSAKIPGYMVPSYFVHLPGIPLTPNGKIDKKALPVPGLGTDEDYTAPRNEIEEKLTRIWAEVLKVEPGKIGIYSSFFDLGGDSIKIMRINAKINKIFDREISLGNFIKAGTIDRLAEYISKNELSRGLKYPSAVPDPSNIYRPFPLTEVQMAYLLGRSDRIEMGGVSTHAYREYRGQLDIERFNLSLNRVITRHPMMRAIITGDGYQRILEDVKEYRVLVEDITRMSPGKQEERLARERQRMSHYIFKTDQWPLFEIKAFKLSQHTFHFCIGFDPLIADASSSMTIARELGQYYENPQLELPALELTFRDYMMAYQELKKSPIAARDREYWLAQLEDFPPAPELPFTCKPSKIKEPHFKVRKKVYERSSWKALREIAGRNNITPSALLCTAYVEVLSHWSNQQKLAVNLTVFNRFPFHKDVEHIVGDFTSLVLLGIQLKPGSTFWERARVVRDRLFAGLEHRHYDGVEFIRELARHRNAVNKAIMTIVFTSALFDESNHPDGRDREEPRQTILNLVDELGFENVTQTSQVYIDNAVSEINGRLIVNWSYVEDIFDSRLIDAMFHQYTAILTHLAQGDYKESHAFALPGAEKRLMEEYNKTEASMTWAPLHRLFTRQVRLNPDHTALIFGNRHLTYKELDNRANQVADYLRQQGVGRYDAVGVLTPRCLETIINILGVLKSGGAYVPIETDYPGERRNYILGNSHCKLFLEPGTYGGEHLAQYPDININEGENRDEHLLEDLAYVIYTSGSTGRPKGVMITHRQAVNTVMDINQKFRVSSCDRLIGISSLCFDLSVYDVFGALSTGAALVLIINQRDIDNIIHVMEKYGVTIWNSVPAVMDLVVNTMVESSFGFTPLRLVLLSGDWIPLNLPDKITRYFPGAEVISLGGATEGSIWSIYYPVTEVKNNWNSIPYGYPLANQRMYVLNYQLQRCPPGVPGEIYIGGTGVAEGYLNDQEKTADSFFYHAQWGRIYRTGDHGVFHRDGYIEFLGRKDHQVKIGGFRIELGEIRGQLLKHPEVKEALVLALEQEPGNKSLCAYLVLKQGAGIDNAPSSSPADFNPGQFKEYLSQSLPVYMIPSYFVRLEHIPLTPNGKIDGKALPAPGITINRNITAPRNEIEKKMAGIWSEVLGIETDRINTDASFFDLGGHSLKVSLLTSKIHKELAVKVPLIEVFERNTIRELSAYVKNKTKAKYTHLEPLEKKEYYALSSAQKRIYFLRQIHADSTAYNLSVVFPLEKDMDKHKLEKALKKLVTRHESLRTSFELVNDQPVQKIHEADTVDLSMDYYETDETGAQEIFKNYIRPFDLSQAPLIRFAVTKLPPDQAIGMLDIHHIVSDGTSQIILLDDFRALYNEEELEPLGYQYKDFTQWQNHWFESGGIKVQEDYWMDLLADAGVIPEMQLPLDFKRPEVFTFAGDVYQVMLEREAVLRLKRLGHHHNGTLYMSLLAILNTLFYKYTDQEDILIGSGIAGRSNADIQQIVGMFVNTLVIRNQPMGEKTYDSFLKEVITHTIDALENQDFQFEELVDKLDLERDLSRNPLFDVCMLVQNFSKPGQRNSTRDNLGQVQTGVLPALDENFSSIKYRNLTAKFDMTFFVYEQAEDYYLNVEYYTAIFKSATIERLISHLQNIIGIVIEESSIKLKDIEIIDEEEKRRILFQWNDTTRDYPRDKSIHQLFAEQVERTPDYTALYGCMEAWRHWKGPITYRELNNKSNQMARLLIEKGVKPDTIVAVMVERSIEMIIGIFGVMKAGGGYLPIDPDYPEERIKYMLADSSTNLLVTTGTLVQEVEKSRSWEGETILLEDLSVSPVPFVAKPPPQALNWSEGRPFNSHHSCYLAYIIYTSGSTGKPKGVLLEHKNLVNYVSWFTRKVDLKERDRTVLTSSFGFDLGYTSLYSSILSGSQLHIPGEEIYLSPENLVDYIVKHEISYMKLTPSLFSTIVKSAEFTTGNSRSLRIVVLGGEEMKLKDVEKAHAVGEHIRIMNHYGPTEATIGCVTQFIDFNKFDHQLERSTIGNPISNMKAVILNKGLKLMATGIPGELCVSGEGVARGYLNQPELTAERFIKAVISHSSFVISSSLKTNDKSSKTTNDQWPMTNDRLYKTGDLARWLPGGTIEFLGRIDSQVKIRGYRIELGEIENRVSTHPAVKEAAVILRQHPSGDKYLCAYIVSNPGGEDINPWELKEYLSETLPYYMIPSFFTDLKRIPLTPNGKLNRKLLPEPDTAALTAYYTAPGDPVEKRLAEVWQEILEVDRIGIDDHFFQLGGHSLKAIILISRVNKAFHIDVPLAEIFRTPTIKGLSAYIKSREGGLFTPIEPEEEKDYHVLSPAQERLYILHQMDESSTGYNMPYAMRLEGEVNKNKLEEIFKKLVSRHESLRTSFQMIDDEPMQRIHDDVEFKIEYDQSLVNGHWSLGNCKGRGEVPSPTKVEKIIRDFIRPFDLSYAPLLRVGLVKENDGKHILMVDMHHIISDGISRRILAREFMAMAAGEDLPPLRLQYKDFSSWQNREAQREALEKQKAYWKKQLEGEIPILDLPTDYARPTIQRFEGSIVSFEIEEEEVNALQSLASAEGVTLYMILLAIYYIFLSKLSNQEDILVGTPTVGRRHADLQQIIGMFVNTLVLRNYPTGNKAYRTLLNEIKNRSVEAFENQDYPYEELVEELAVTRDVSRNPLFDTMFVLQNIGIPGIEIPGLKLTPDEQRIETSKFDLTLMGIEAEEKLLLSFEYSTNLFKKAAIERFIAYLKKVVSSVVTNPDVKICELEILLEEEKRQVLYDFNNTKAGYPEDKDIHELYAEQAEKSPDRTALAAFDLISVTYKELNEQSNRAAGLLSQQSVRPDTIVAIMAHRSVETIIGILGILKAGGAYLPIDPEYPQERINYILADSAAKILLTSDAINRVPTPSHLHLSPTPLTAVSSSSTLTSTCRVSPSNLAYVLYTSGSTGRPKGVAVQHGSVVNILWALFKKYPLLKEDTYLLKTTYTFDVSVSELFGWYLGGGRLAILEPGGEKDPHTILDWNERCRVTHINFVPSMFGVFLEILDTRKISGLSNLKYIFLAGEALAPHLVTRFNQLNTGIKLENIYGPSENTIYASQYSLLTWQGVGSIPIGKPLNNIRAYILNASNQLQPIGVWGELCIGGEGLARGYLNRPGLTAERFDHDLWDYQDYRDKRKKVPGKNKPCSHAAMQSCNHASMQYNYPPHYPITPLPHSPIYRTGDLARWLADGNIEFLGRIDHQVKIRGFRIEPGEIENRLLKHNEIKKAVVLTGEDEKGDRYLCAYIVPARSPSSEAFDITGLRNDLLKFLPGYMIPSYFVQVNDIPLTPTGKIDRGALPSPEIGAGEKYIAPRDAVESRLTDIWKKVLLLSVPIGIDDHFFQLGGHSLKAITLLSKIHQTFHVKLSLAEIFKKPTIRELSQYIETKEKDRYTSLKNTEKKEYYALSSAQKRLYLLQRMDRESTAYNMPSAIILAGMLEKAKLEDSFKKLIRRHESLRTSFDMVGEEPVQRVHDQMEFEIEYFGAKSKAQSAERKEERHAPCAVRHASFVRPFDLSQAPLLRVKLVEQEKQKHLLMVDMHHIISDGMSGGVLVQDFVSLYSGNTLPEMRYQYKGYAQWQNQEKESIRVQDQARYWQKEFEEDIPVLDLPTDDVRPGVQRFEGSRLSFEISKETTHALKALALEQGATLYMVLLAIYTIFLSKISNQEDIVIGAPVAGRIHADLEKIIGMFVNTLALRHYPTGEKKLIRFLAEVKEKTLQAFENQEYQYEDLVEQVVVNRDVSRNPLLDVIFLLQNMEISELAVPGLKLTPYEYETVTSKFDLTLMGMEVEEKLLLHFEYSTNLFKKVTIERFATYLKKIASIIVDNLDVKICDLEILLEEEKRQVLYDFNNTTADYPKDKVLHELIAEQAEKNPDSMAVIGPAQSAQGRREPWALAHAVTYGELNEKSNQLARLLRAKGVQPETIAGIMVEQSIEMVIGILAILKAGGAYLPIDPQYPQQRIMFFLEDSRSNLLLTQKKLISKQGTICEIIDLEETNLYKGDTSNLEMVNIPTNLAYVIYTSGSTGTPKGTLIQHHSLNNLCHWHNKYYSVTARDRATKYAGFGFDASVWEIFPYLISGADIYIIHEEIKSDIHQLNRFIEENHITIAFLPTQICERFMTLQNHSLRILLTGGDKLRTYIKRNYQLVNNYGPTENTVVSTSFLVDSRCDNIPIGKPISNNHIYILNKDNNIQPIGIPGELCISGDSLARGYLNNPELTAEKFDHDLWDYQNDQDKRKKVPGKRIHMSYRSYRPYISKKIYKTGDLARWLPDGNIEFLGRIDHQVKIRGFRIELGEIENHLLKHQDIEEAIVIADKDENEDKYLCAYIVSDHKLSVSRLRNYLSKDLPGYMIPSYFAALEELPLTPNGKVDRQALPNPDKKKLTGDYIAPRNLLEKKLVEIWSGVLDIKKNVISTNSDFFQLGGHSLKGAILVSKIHKEFNIKMPLPGLFKSPTIMGLVRYISGAIEEKFTAIEPVEKKEYHALSSAQKRVFILQQMDECGTGYNIPAVMELEGNVDRDKLQLVFRKLIHIHESLRTSFNVLEKKPVQRVHDDPDFEIEYYGSGNRQKAVDNKEEIPSETIIENFIRPFDLSRASLLRVGLLTTGTGANLLMADLHHIISDGISNTILMKNFMDMYRNQELPPLRIQYKDFAEWQNRQRGSAAVKKQQEYWLKEFSREVPRLNLPTDFARPGGYSFEGNTVDFTLGKEEVDALKALGTRENATLYMVLFAIFTVLMTKLSGNEDIVIGCPTAGRWHPDLHQLIGMFVNTLAIRCSPGGQKSFGDFLKEVRDKILNAFENQEYQFEDLVNDLAVDREEGHHPLFDILLALQNFDREGIGNLVGDTSDLKLKEFKYEHRKTKFDIMIVCIEIGNQLTLIFSYRTKLYKKETIERFTGYFREIVSTIIQDPDKKIANINILNQEKQNKLIEKLKEEKGELNKNVEENQEQPEILEADFEY